jgi:ParB family transcriptional regulator, chromosome partitioning protein
MSDKMTINTAKRQRGLGRGLNALFEDDEVTFATQGAGNPIPEIPVAPAQNNNSASAAAPAATNAGPRRTLGIDLLQPSPFQPRQYMDENALSELAQSVAVHGVLQPILVRPVPGQSNKWEIIAGVLRNARNCMKCQLLFASLMMKPPLKLR